MCRDLLSVRGNKREVTNLKKTRKLALVLVAAASALVWAVGGWAMAGTKATPVKVARVTHTATTTSKPATSATVKTAETSTTETPGEVSGESSSETSTAEEPGDANLPGGGHADPSGDVQHEFNGVE
jgi:ABC-type Na+ efflux pump permease subunit